MTRDALKRWLGGGLLVVAAPGITGCVPQYYPSDCNRLMPWNGRLIDGGPPSDAGLDSLTCNVACNSPTSCSIADAGLVLCINPCVGGRAPPGLLTLSGVDGSAGSYVSRMAELETAAVTAFVQLADELEAHGLPQFASYALKAAEQEVRHAHDVTRLALSLGHCPRPHTLHPTGLRSLDEVALDNAGEGCGRELMGAVINAHQAKTAGNPLVRKTMAGIADDEREHAGFSFELAGALMPRLSASQRRRAREAQEQTLAQLSSDELPQSTRALLGLMNPDQLKTAAGRLLEGWRL